MGEGEIDTEHVKCVRKFSKKGEGAVNSVNTNY